MNSTSFNSLPSKSFSGPTSTTGPARRLWSSKARLPSRSGYMGGQSSVSKRFFRNVTTPKAITPRQTSTATATPNFPTAEGPDELPPFECPSTTAEADEALLAYSQCGPSHWEWHRHAGSLQYHEERKQVVKNDQAQKLRKTMKSGTIRGIGASRNSKTYPSLFVTQTPSFTQNPLFASVLFLLLGGVRVSPTVQTSFAKC